MKVIRNILKTTVWTIIVIYLIIIVMVHIPFVQTMLGSRIAEAVGAKLNTRVTVGKVSLGFLNRIIIDDLALYDQSSKMMIKSSRVAARIDYIQLLRTGRVSVSSAQLFGFNGVFYKQDEASAPNYQFMLDSLASKNTDKKSSLELSVNSLIIRRGAFKYDRYDKPPTPSRLNLNHIDVKNISAHLILPYYTTDSVAVQVRKLSFIEESGLDMRHLSLKLAINKRKATINDLDIKLPNTEIKLKKLNAAYEYKNDELYKPSLRYDAVIEKSKIFLRDVAFIVPAFKDMSQSVYVASLINGDANSINIKRLDMASDGNAISLNATGRMVMGTETRWMANIKRLNLDIPNIHDALRSSGLVNGELLPYLVNMRNVGYVGKVSGANNKLLVQGTLTTGVGNASIRVDKTRDLVNAYVDTKEINLNKLLDNRHFGMVALKANFKATVNKSGLSMLTINGLFPRFDYNDYQYRNINVNGSYDKKIFNGSFELDDPNGRIALNGMVNTNMAGQESAFTLDVSGLDLAALRITDKWKGSKLDFRMEAKGEMYTSDSNFFNGDLNLRDLSLAADDNGYHLENLRITADNDRLYMKSDFGEAEIKGRYKINTMAQSVSNLLRSKLPMVFKAYANTDNEFQLNASITKSDWLQAFFDIPLELKAPLNIKAAVNDKERDINLQVTADRLVYDGSPYRRTQINATTMNDTLRLEGTSRRIGDKGNWLEFMITADAIDDKLTTGIKWRDDKRSAFTGALYAETEFISNPIGAPDIHVEVKPSEILINDTTWQVKPALITYNDGNLIIDHFAIEHDNQYLKIAGMATKNMSDSITVDMRDIDVGYVLNLVNFHAVKFDGYATGRAYIKSAFYDPDLYANLTVSHFTFEDGRMGKLFANVTWNKEDKQIDIDAHADDQNKAQTLISGYVSPSKDFIDLSIKAKDTNVEFLESLCGSFMGDVDARANGEVRLHGPLSAINLTGALVTDGKVRIKPLNTTYQLTNDTIRFIPDNILFAADTIRDHNGNIGIVNGVLRHKHLTRLTYDLNISTNNLLCYDTNAYSNDTFYGTVYGTGTCSIKGGGGRVDMDINITPDKNSFIEYDAASPETITDPQFITWHDKTGLASVSPNDTSTVANDLGYLDNDEIDISSDIRINFRINMTNDATLRVLMDKKTEDYIALNGTGSIQASYFNKGSFEMFGSYLIDHGIYKLTIQNIIKKVFQFQPGGTIVFGGDPYNAALRLQAMYTINGVPLSDLQIGRSFSSNNIRVDCLMNISGTPLAPKVDFDLDLPNVNNDAAQMVRTIINGEEEMNQQVVYLLGVGRFYMQRSNNSGEQDDQQNQTSLAMQSLLSGTISQQINSLLGNIIKNDNWTFGANISTGDEGFNNAEYEGLLSGRLLNNRLLINGQFGYRDNANATTSFIGDFDINYLLQPNGNIAVKVYNQTNDRYFTKSSLNTQGIGLIMKKDFNSFQELLGLRRKEERQRANGNK